MSVYKENKEFGYVSSSLMPFSPTYTPITMYLHENDYFYAISTYNHVKYNKYEVLE
jgi:hypothetical protein